MSLAACYAPSGLGLWVTSLRAPALFDAAAAVSTTTTHAITLGDGPLPALAARAAGVANITAVVTSSAGAAAAVGRAASVGTTAVAPPPPPPSTLSLLLLAEPHYRAAEARPPWEALFRFIRDRQALQAAGSFGDGTTGLITSPSRARLVAVGATLPDLARTAQPLVAVEGVSMAPFDAAMKAGCASNDSPTGKWVTPSRSVSWQCGAYAEVTGRVILPVTSGDGTSGGGDGLGLGGMDGLGDLASVALPSSTSLTGTATLEARTAGTIDALVFWVEYGYGGAGGSGDPFTPSPTAPAAGPTGGPSPGAQAVWLLPSPLAVPAAGGLHVTLALDVDASPDLGGRVEVTASVEIV